ncbi:VCBS repeat-containing protein [Streptomyces sp. TRM S81-3]|uniref:VCBS repeat-containing protein n=1 Tax=Streptomyces griseicoloratus TaxID=2752516 RepID=A0A926L9X1_9ACTN|nr:VCBS repeat-containing protein [Streptomyces griseicoloratus]MBD0424715.1 VCBS repeat-containing protein [Streptomyces griseicoloratus]
MIVHQRRWALRGALAATAVTAAMAATAGTAFAAGDPAGVDRMRAAAGAEQQALDAQSPGPNALAAAEVETPSFAMKGVHKQTSELYLYFTDREGGFEPREHVAVSFDGFADSIDVDNDKDGWSDGTWSVHKNGILDYSWIDDDLVYHSKQVGKGWNIYPTILSPGNLGGAKEADLIGLDEAGVLWGYLAYPDGTLTSRMRIGGGWGQYTQLAGQGDLTGDGKADIVARDKSGVLWLYKGTGDYKAPFESRTRIGGGWNVYDRLLSVGDLDADGTPDLIARRPDGDLYRYSGTGSAQAVYEKPVKIGHGFQIYNLL